MLVKIPFEWKCGFLCPRGVSDRYIACATSSKWTLYSSLERGSHVAATGYCRSFAEGKAKVEENLKLL